MKNETDRIKKKFPQNFFKWFVFSTDAQTNAVKSFKVSMIEGIFDGDSLSRVDRDHVHQQIDSSWTQIGGGEVLPVEFGEGGLNWYNSTLKKG